MYNEVFIDGIIIDCDTIYVGVFVVVGGVVLQVIISRKLNCGDLVGNLDCSQIQGLLLYNNCYSR